MIQCCSCIFIMVVFVQPILCFEFEMLIWNNCSGSWVCKYGTLLWIWDVNLK